MPVYLFTYHAYGTWMPDHKQGYVKRGEGIQVSDSQAARGYRDRQSETTIRFDRPMQQLLVTTASATGQYLAAVVHSVFTDTTHVHVLMSWTHERTWKSMRSSVKRALSMGLNQTYGHRQWLADSASRKQVRDREHFDYLITEYRQKHGGAEYIRRIDRDRAQRHKP